MIKSGIKLCRSYNIPEGKYQSICRRFKPTLYQIGVLAYRKPFWGPLTLFDNIENAMRFLLLEGIQRGEYYDLHFFDSEYIPSKQGWVWEPEPTNNSKARQYSKILPPGTILGNAITLKEELHKPVLEWMPWGNRRVFISGDFPSSWRTRA